jgi:hypothetical protein
MVASFDGELIPNNNPQNLVPFIPSHRFLQLNTIARQKPFICVRKQQILAMQGLAE